MCSLWFSSVFVFFLCFFLTHSLCFQCALSLLSHSKASYCARFMSITLAQRRHWNKIVFLLFIPPNVSWLLFFTIFACLNCLRFFLEFLLFRINIVFFLSLNIFFFNVVQCASYSVFSMIEKMIFIAFTFAYFCFCFVFIWVKSLSSGYNFALKIHQPNVSRLISIKYAKVCFQCS